MPRASGFLQHYVAPIGGGTVLFVAIAMILVIPYVIVQYNRRGRVGARRTVVEASFLLYLICAWALVVLPLPDVTGEFCATKIVRAQTTAFAWVHDTYRQWSRAGGEPMDLLRSTALWVRVFNVVLLLPLGVYLRRWWQRGFLVTALIGLGMSLAFELTQLTGNWHLYPCAYRTFDVDDLIANTAGAMLGWVIAPLVFFLPSRRPEDDRPATREHASIPRRFVADLVDVALVVALSVPLVALVRMLPQVATPIWGELEAATLAGEALACVIVLWLVPSLAAGRTAGKAVVRLRIGNHLGGPTVSWRLAVRAVVLWLPIIAPLWVLDSINTDGLAESTLLLAWFVAMLALPWVWTIAVTATVLVRHDDRGPHDLASGTLVDVASRPIIPQ